MYSKLRQLQPILIAMHIIKKYLASFVDDTTLDWENFLPALMLSYNMRYHSTITTTPFELLFGERPCLLSFPNLDIQRLHNGKSTSAERYQLLQKIRFLASDQGDKIKDNFDTNAFQHCFQSNDLVWYEEVTPWGKTTKLTPIWQGPAKITCARVMLSIGKIKILNVMCIKKNFPPLPKSETVSENNDFNFNSEPKITSPITQAMRKLLDQQKATEMAIHVLFDHSKTHCSMCEWEQDCSDNPLLFDPTFARRYIAERCSWLINKQSTCTKCKLQLGKHLLYHQGHNTASKIDTNNNH